MDIAVLSVELGQDRRGQRRVVDNLNHVSITRRGADYLLADDGNFGRIGTPRATLRVLLDGQGCVETLST